MPGATTSVATQCSTNYILFSKKLVAPGVASLKNIILKIYQILRTSCAWHRIFKNEDNTNEFEPMVQTCKRQLT